MNKLRYYESESKVIKNPIGTKGLVAIVLMKNDRIGRN